MRKAVVVLSVVAGVAGVRTQRADAVIPSVFGGDVACTVAGDGVRECGRPGTNETQQS